MTAISPELVKWQSASASGPVVSDSWWKFVFGVAPDPNGDSIDGTVLTVFKP